MTKSKNSSTSPRDRLSELPNNLIFEIFWLLPMSDVVRTTILSKRWKNLWTTADLLNFEDRVTDTADKVRTFIYQALMLWKGSRIIKFRIRLDYRLAKSLHSDIDIWLRFATDHQVEVLYVDLNNLGYGDVDTVRRYHASDSDRFFEDTYLAPRCLYSCSSLKRLFLYGCSLIEVHENVHWNQLECLCIYGWITRQKMKRVLSGSPQLETLSLHLLDGEETLSILSSSLIHLHIEMFFCADDDVPSMNPELIINTPELHILEMSGVPCSKYLLMNSPYLSGLTLGFDGPPNCYRHDHLFNGNRFLEKTLIQILPTIQLVEELKLSDWCIKALGAMKKKNVLQPLPNIEFLELKYEYSFEGYERIVGLLEIFPKLETLFLQPQTPNQIPANKAERLRRNLPAKSFLRNLRMADVTWINGDDSIFPFIEIVLKYARKLRKMVFRPQGTVPTNCLLLASKKLLRMPKSSPTLELVFL